jgi:hypothetical protein
MNVIPTESAMPFPHEPIPPELLAWVQQTFDPAEFINEVREIESTGGQSFESLIKEVETIIRTQ